MTTFALLRKFGQPVEFDPQMSSALRESIRVSSIPATGHCERYKDADLIYYVDLPEGASLVPADWRFLVGSPDKLRELIGEVIFHSLRPLQFEAQSDALFKSAKHVIRLALFDLSRAFDLLAVRCESEEPGAIRSTIEGEYKNGERFVLVLEHRNTA